MLRMRLRWQSFTPLALLAVSLFLNTGALAQTTAQNSSAKDENLKKFLQNYESKVSSPEQKTTRYAVAWVDLKEDGKQEALVYLLGPEWCGSGGCSCLILAPSGSSFKIITRTTVTQLPVSLLPEKTNGWRDLAVGVGGGGIQPGYEARLKFNGKKYPSNPTVPPAQKLPKNAHGKVVIPEEPEWKELGHRQ